MKRRLNSEAQTKIDKRNKSKFPLPEQSVLIDSERGSVMSLVKVQEVTCFNQKGPLARFHLYGENGWISNNVGYEWGCLNDKIPQGQNVKFSTVSSAKKGNYSKSSSPKILNEVEVDCKDGFISSFRLQKSNIELYYSASCMNLKQKACETKKTKATEVAWLGFFSDTVSNLDQVPLEAPANKGLVSFKLIIEGKNVLYEYKACEVDLTPVIETAPVPQVKRFNADNLNVLLDNKRRRRRY